MLITLVNASKKQYVLTADLGTESCRVGIFDKFGNLISTSHSNYPTYFPSSGHAEQDPNDWWDKLKTACHNALIKENILSDEILSICIDTTACSVCILDEDKQPLMNCILWCDARSSSQTKEILNKCKGDPYLNVNCNGSGPISAEWMIPVRFLTY